VEWVSALDSVGRKSLFPVTAATKTTRWVIKQNGVVAYSGACHFQRKEGGSFSIRRHDGDIILTSTTHLSVCIVSNGKDEVHGLSTADIHSRWGAAVRSKLDFAWWTAPTFEIYAD
jgi:hypothetical protein